MNAVVANKVRMKAIAFGTFTARDGSILHFNPDADDERYHSPLLDEIDVKEAEQRGLGERRTGKAAVVREDDIEQAAAVSTVATVGAEEIAKVAKIDHQVDPAPSALDTQSTVAWAEPEQVRGPIEGSVSNSGISDGDPDAAPIAPTAETAPRTAAKPAGTTATPAASPKAGKKPATAPQKTTTQTDTAAGKS